MITVYISSPYTLGDVAQNVRRQFEISEQLVELGFLPFAPLYTHFWHMIYPHEYEYWMRLDLEWVKQCDCVLRLPGESAGADREVAYAEKVGIPVVYSIEELVEKFKWYVADRNLSLPKNSDD